MLAACQNAPEFAEIHREIWIQQDRRELQGSLLFDSLKHRDPKIRQRAARALGSIGRDKDDPRIAEALIPHLRDQHRNVQRACIFALGEARGGDRSQYYRRFLTGADPELCADALQSLRPQDQGALPLLPQLLQDGNMNLRGLAALASLRLLGKAEKQNARPEEKEQRQRLGAALRTSLHSTPSSQKKSDPQAHWRLVYALAMLREDAAMNSLQAIARDPDAPRWSRLFAIRGLAELPCQGSIRDSLLQVLDDQDWLLVYEACSALAKPSTTEQLPAGALAQAQYGDSRVAKALLKLLRHPHAHVRQRVTLLLGNFKEQIQLVTPDLRYGSRDLGMQAATVQALARLQGMQALPDIRLASQHAHWRVRLGSAKALRFLPAQPALLGLQVLLGDSDVRVRTAALENVGKFKHQAEAVKLALLGLAEQDLAMRETAALSLQALGDVSAVPALMQAFSDSPGLDFAEARKLILHAVAELNQFAFIPPSISGDAPEPPHKYIAFLRVAAQDPQPVVRKEALLQMRDLGETAPSSTTNQIQTLIPGQDIPWSFMQQKPVIQVTTNRGAFEITLRPEHAPVHCFSLMKLIEADQYLQRSFHRVVPNFVVQGGDRRGDGYGNIAFHGGQLRDEISPLLFAAGTVGMPKTADAHTGGDQIFITLTPTPRLDRQYTVLGNVTSGMSVVERIQIGDFIRRISISAH